jgi:hypothetical protein
LLFNFEISTPNDKSQFILILLQWLERINSHLILTTDCTVSINARIKRKVADLGKRRATDLHLIAAQKFLSEVTGLSARNVDHGVCVTKLHAIDRRKHPYGLLLVGNKTDFTS